MIGPPHRPTFTDVDRQVFEALVPADHYLRRVSQCVDFERFRTVVADRYSPNHGRPSEDVVLLVKLEFLQYHDNYSDRQVLDHARTDAAYRWFLGLSLEDSLPDPSTLCIFRGRLGQETHGRVFQELVRQAREQGFVKDRLRLKDATHVIANIALPTTLALIAQTRDRLLTAAQPFDPLRVEGERARVEALRASTETRTEEERLVARVTHLREIVAWVDLLPAPDRPEEPAWLRLQSLRETAHKILNDQQTGADDLTRSLHDPDARRGKHGDFYDGYALDVMMDADSELITAIEVLPANGDEGGNTVNLVRQEQTAQGNQVERLSIDGAGYHGPMLRELTDPSGLNVDVFVPPKSEPITGLFRPEHFVADATGQHVQCPAGQTSHYRQVDHHTVIHRFRLETCRECPLQGQCLEKKPKSSSPFGRTVRKNIYEREYRQVREKSLSAEYQTVRHEHPKIERKLSELINRHGARRARYRGRLKVLSQAFVTALAVNIKRIVRLSTAQPREIRIATT